MWLIRAKLQLEKRTRDLALFNLAIDSKLRGCDLVALRVDDMAPNGYAVDRANVRPRLAKSALGQSRTWHAGVGMSAFVGPTNSCYSLSRAGVR